MTTIHPPVHPAVVHFPIVLWSVAPLAQGWFLLVQDAPLVWELAFWLVLLGVISGGIAAVTGFLDFVNPERVPRDSPAQRLAQSHMRWMMAAWACFAVELALVSPDLPTRGQAILAFTISLAGAASLVRGGHQAGRLVYGPGGIHSSERRPNAD